MSSTGAALTYQLIDANSIFNIERTTGTIRLTSTLDYETTSVYFLRVEASDSGTPPNKAETLVQIDVENVNDEQPQINSFPLNVSLAEGSYIDSIPLTIGQLNCSDLDDGVFGQTTFQIVGGNFGNVFGITTSGVLQLVSGLDYETHQSYSLTIVCEDGGSPPRSDSIVVSIYILPISNNASDFGTTPGTGTTISSTPVSDTTTTTSTTSPQAANEDSNLTVIIIAAGIAGGLTVAVLVAIILVLLIAVCCMAKRETKTTRDIAELQTRIEAINIPPAQNLPMVLMNTNFAYSESRLNPSSGAVDNDESEYLSVNETYAEEGDVYEVIQ